ncbi:GNAT family N-acetyltransferase [Cohnella sp. GCM10027633]|uniref:GNAT family N-acetyltransferase n=1 Tax=unclassified Cohnella TaxID=2636738 RepID=UPI0036428CD3
MFIDIRSRLGDPVIRELIGMSVFPDEGEPERTIEQYASGSDQLRIMGYESQGQVVGFVGFEVDVDGLMTLRHIAVLPDSRGAGFGRGMILELLHQFEPRAIVAETDEDAVHFYRSIGFRIESLGESYPGVERFRCLYDALEQAD